MKKIKGLGWAAIIIVLVVVGIYIMGTYGSLSPKDSRDINPDTLPGIQTGSAPWEANVDTLKERLRVIGLPALREEGMALHIHQHVDIYVDGNTVAMPSDIGDNEAEGFISPIHTHDGTGIIHVESRKIQRFTLGQFFDIWGVRLTDRCLGGYCNDNEKKLRVFVNGLEINDNFRTIELIEHQEIVIAYGTDKELPSPMPVRYSFPLNY